MPVPKWIVGTPVAFRAAKTGACAGRRTRGSPPPKRADPRVEDLDRLGAGLDLRDDEPADDLGEPVAQPVPGLRVPVHQRLGTGEVARRPAFDGVGRQSERRAGEADQRDAAVELAPGHERSRRARSRGLRAGRTAGAVRCRRGPHGWWTTALRPSRTRRRAHGLERQQDVREEDRGVHVEGVERLQGHCAWRARASCRAREGVPSEGPGIRPCSGRPGA